jgi:hypothetical protein
LALVAACLAIGYVAGRPGAPAQPASYLEQLTEILDLSQSQVISIEAILAEEDRAVDAMLAAQLEGLREDVATQRALTEHALLGQLDDDQRERYELLAAGTSEQR